MYVIMLLSLVASSMNILQYLFIYWALAPKNVFTVAHKLWLVHGGMQ